ncbi:shikimate dehydrogenase [Thalassomonas sp. M1454]|uniref:shikimate dehydrogenase n=1 Tax=Thalassomonas sp. M1454 TaxID=2594477 RepID=UPI00117CDF1C|nr:shikimate dehydrogenase [Thalassomonas sp. M1454]TRX58170.1 shikimate dehydrogenase [Thalassomonas sp. M1454]
MDKYLVLGNPIAQSRSPSIHQLFAKQTDQNIAYDKQLVELDNFNNHINTLIAQGIKGVNVTMPFKEQALAISDQLSDRAELAGAVNTLSFVDGKIFGDNTDGVGLVNDLKSQQVEFQGKRILLLGAGGAARGVLLPLLSENPALLCIANRTVSKAESLVATIKDSRAQAISFAQTQEFDFDIIINATSTSLSADIPPISSQCISINTVCYDMVYSKEETTFLKWCRAHGAKQVIDGLGMLVGQAAESFRIWRGVMPDIAPVLANLRVELSKD